MGSDYTPGVKGIAAVNAIEIINCFGSKEEDLIRFRKWVDINTQIKDKLTQDETAQVKKAAKDRFLGELQDALNDGEEPRERNQEEIEQEFLHKHRNLRKHWIFPDDFPNFEVIKAFKQPKVDQSKDTFTWGDPDFAEIRRYALDQLNWKEVEMTKYVDVVEKRVAELKRKRKGTLDNYFKTAPVSSSDIVQSRRVGQAVADLKHKRRKIDKKK